MGNNMGPLMDGRMAGLSGVRPALFKENDRHCRTEYFRSTKPIVL